MVHKQTHLSWTFVTAEIAANTTPFFLSFWVCSLRSHKQSPLHCPRVSSSHLIFQVLTIRKVPWTSCQKQKALCTSLLLFLFMIHFGWKKITFFLKFCLLWIGRKLLDQGSCTYYFTSKFFFFKLQSNVWVSFFQGNPSFQYLVAMSPS